MVTLVIGGSGSGKSEYAENLVLESSAPGERYYIATMARYGEEAEKRIRRHLSLREGKGFETVELSRDIFKAVEYINDPKNATVLIEDVPNLLANEMFGRMKDAGKSEDLAHKTVLDILFLCGKVKNAVIVTDNIFEDGIEYDVQTMEYMEYLGHINSMIARASDRGVEVIAGLPLEIKNDKNKGVL